MARASQRAGALRDIITIEEKVQGAWRAKHTDLPADISALTGRERWQAEQVASQVTTVITIRYTTGVTAKDRVVSGSRVFDVKAVVDPDNLAVWMRLECTEVAVEP